MKTLLVSLPWFHHQSPSASIGYLSAYIKSRRHTIEALHLHLEIAADLGIDIYQQIADGSPVIGESIFASILLSAEKKRFEKILQQHGISLSIIKKAERFFLKSYRGIRWSKYAIVGITANHAQLFSSLLLAEYLKRDYPHIKILLGGSLVSGALGISILQHFSQIDYCVDGEGEITLHSFLDSIRSSDGLQESKIPGLIYRSPDGVTCNAQKKMTHLKTPQSPDYDHYFKTLHTNTKLQNVYIHTYIPIEMSRGCPHKCAFCSSNSYWKGYRAYSADSVAKLIQNLSEKYETNSFYFISLTPALNTIRRLFSRLTIHEGSYRIFCECRAEITKPLLKLMRSVGIFSTQIGIESLSSRLLKKMHKGSRVIDNIKAMKFCEELGIDHHSNIILGFPTETQSDVNQCIKAIDYVSAYQPLQITTYSLRVGSPTERHPSRYDITNIRNVFDISTSMNCATVFDFYIKDFDRAKRKADHIQLIQRVSEWRSRYDGVRNEGYFLLSYYDHQDFLLIEDYREGSTSIILDGWIRKLYLFCDDIMSFAEIKRKFKKTPVRQLQRALGKLLKLKIMYTEDDDWLSLAIHASSENRRFTPFL